MKRVNAILFVASLFMSSAIMTVAFARPRALTHFWTLLPARGWRAIETVGLLVMLAAMALSIRNRKPRRRFRAPMQ